MARTNIGSRWASELTSSQDSISGATVRQYTNYKAHSHHFYFTYPCWYDNGRKIVIYSDRDNRSNLYGVDLTTGDITQLTDLDPALKVGGLSKNPAREEIYFTYGDTLTALDLLALNTRPLFTRPKGYVGGSADATADGKYLCAGYTQDLSDRFMVDLATATSALASIGKRIRTRRFGKSRLTAATCDSCSRITVGWDISMPRPSCRTSSPSATKVPGTRWITVSGAWM